MGGSPGCESSRPDRDAALPADGTCRRFAAASASALRSLSAFPPPCGRTLPERIHGGTVLQIEAVAPQNEGVLLGVRVVVRPCSGDPESQALVQLESGRI